VVQETIICVAKDIHKFKRDRQMGSFKGWLRNLTRWRIADQLRRRTALVPDGHGPGEESFAAFEAASQPPDESAAAEWEKEWQSNLLKAALERVKLRVSEEQYQLFDLCVFQQWPPGRITRTLGVSAARVYLAKHRVTRLVEREVRRLEKEWNSG
jgi:RNA polymerase sigma-70 factor (ECF subfamily)